MPKTGICVLELYDAYEHISLKLIRRVDTEVELVGMVWT